MHCFLCFFLLYYKYYYVYVTVNVINSGIEKARGMNDASYCNSGR